MTLATLIHQTQRQRGYASVVLGLGPVAYWRMDGGTLQDEVSGQAATAADISYGSPLLSRDAGAAIFNGASSVVATPAGGFGSASQWSAYSFAIWARYDGPSSRRTSWSDGSFRYALLPGIGGSDTWQVRSRRDADVAVFTSFSASFGVVHHIAATHSIPDDRIRVYVDGALADEVALGATAFADSLSSGVAIGVRSGVEFFEGAQSHFAIWHRALTAAEIQTLYLAGINGTR